MKSRIIKAIEGGFSEKKMRVENRGGRYVVYQCSNVFWIPMKTKLISCDDIETLREIDRRCKLGLKISKEVI